MVIYLLFCPKCKRKHLDLIRLWFLCGGVLSLAAVVLCALYFGKTGSLDWVRAVEPAQ